jgi:hypothetical protein
MKSLVIVLSFTVNHTHDGEIFATVYTYTYTLHQNRYAYVRMRAIRGLFVLVMDIHILTLLLYLFHQKR